MEDPPDPYFSREGDLIDVYPTLEKHFKELANTAKRYDLSTALLQYYRKAAMEEEFDTVK